MYFQSCLSTMTFCLFQPFLPLYLVLLRFSFFRFLILDTNMAPNYPHRYTKLKNSHISTNKKCLWACISPERIFRVLQYILRSFVGPAPIENLPNFKNVLLVHLIWTFKDGNRYLFQRLIFFKCSKCSYSKYTSLTFNCYILISKLTLQRNKIQHMCRSCAWSPKHHIFH